MWRDIGLDHWLFDRDRPVEVERLVATVLSLAQAPEAARDQAVLAAARVRKLQMTDEVSRQFMVRERFFVCKALAQLS